MTRKCRETGDLKKKYVRNVRYMFPKIRTVEAKNKDHLRTTSIQPRELFDLTNDDSEGVSNVQNLCDVINLDDTDFNEDQTSSVSCNFTENFISQNVSTFNKCPFCEGAVRSHQFESHADKCRGYQQKVEFKLSGAVPFTNKNLSYSSNH